MDNYSWLAAMVGMVLALGITRLLAGGVTLFRSRKKAALDWLPVVWAGCILFSMLEFSFVLRHLSATASSWSFATCVFLMGFAVVLFVAAALILPAQELPEGGSLRAEFAEDGRWALTALALFDFGSVFVNWWYFSSSLLSFVTLINLLLAALALVALLASSRRWKVLATVSYAAIIMLVAFLVA